MITLDYNESMSVHYMRYINFNIIIIIVVVVVKSFLSQTLY